MLIGHWPLNGNTNDYSGYNNNGTPTNLTYSDGKIGQAGAFNGTTSYVTIANQMNLLGSWSFCVWLKLSASTKTYQFLAGNAANSGTTGKIMARYSGKIAYSCPATNYISFTLNTDDIVGSWNHLSFIANGSGISLYLNGIYNSRITYTNPSLNVTTIGNAWSDTTWLTGGQINDVRIYDHALSEYEIKELAKAKILHYTFDDMQEPTTNISTSINFYGMGYGLTYTYIGIDGEGWHKWSISGTGTSDTYPYTVNITPSNILLSQRTSFSFKYKTNVQSKYVEGFRDPRMVNITYAAGFTITDIDRGIYREAKIENVSPASGSEVQTQSIYFLSRPIEGVTFNPVTDFVYFKDVQSERKAYATEYTPSSRTAKVNDYSGFFNHSGAMTEANTPRWISEAKMGTGAYEFNSAKNQYLLIANKQGKVTDQITVSAWAYRSNWQDGLKEMIISCTEGGGFNIEYNEGPGTIRPAFYLSGLGYITPSLSVSMLTSGWHLFTGTFDGRYSKFYVDGQLKSTIDAGATYSIGYNATNSVFIGAEASSSETIPAGQYWNGYIDDVRIYATALSATDILAIYNKRANLDNLGNVQVNELDINGIGTDTNVVPYYNMAVGTYTTAQNWYNYVDTTNYIYQGAVTNYTAEIYSGANPYGQLDRILKITNTATHYVQYRQLSLRYHFNNIDTTKTYRVSQWVNTHVEPSTSYSQNWYFGVEGSMVCNVNTTTVNANPYFTAPAVNNAEFEDKWVLWVYYIFPYGSTGNPTNGTWYRTNGTSFTSSTNFNWQNGVTSTYLRQYIMYQYGEIAAGTYSQIYRPRIDVVDGTEPSIDTIWKCGEHRPLINDSGVVQFSRKDFTQTGAAFFSGIDEVTGTANPSAQQEISKNGSLIINGEFSEVDL